MSTVLDRKSARYPELNMRARSRSRGRRQRNHADQRYVACRSPVRPDARHGAREYRRRGRIRGHHEMTRGAENRERQRREEQRIEARDHRHAGNARIAQYLGNVHRRKRHARNGIAHRPTAAERPQAPEKD